MRAAARLDRTVPLLRPIDSREAELFADALDRPVAERARFLQKACGHDAELKAEVESLLRVFRAAQEFFARRWLLRTRFGPEDCHR